MAKLLVDEGLPQALRAVIGHFMFEYVHPFYDGNGRTGRYLLSQELAHALGPLTALRLSRKVSELKKAYYRAFEDVENPLNRADATLFVLPLLRMIAETQVELMEDLQERRQRLGRLEETLKEMPFGAEAERSLLYVLGQAHLFSRGGMGLRELGESLERSPQTVRRRPKAWEQRGLVVSSGKPLVFRLTEEGLKRLGLDG